MINMAIFITYPNEAVVEKEKYKNAFTAIPSAVEAFNGSVLTLIAIVTINTGTGYASIVNIVSYPIMAPSPLFTMNTGFEFKLNGIVLNVMQMSMESGKVVIMWNNAKIQHERATPFFLNLPSSLI